MLGIFAGPGRLLRFGHLDSFGASLDKSRRTTLNKGRVRAPCSPCASGDAGFDAVIAGKSLRSLRICPRAVCLLGLDFASPVAKRSIGKLRASLSEAAEPSWLQSR